MNGTTQSYIQNLIRTFIFDIVKTDDISRLISYGHLKSDDNILKLLSVQEQYYQTNVMSNAKYSFLMCGSIFGGFCSLHSLLPEKYGFDTLSDYAIFTNGKMQWDGPKI